MIPKSSLDRLNQNNSKFKLNELRNIIECLDYKNSKKDFVNLLELKFCKIFKTKYAIACNSGTSALHAAVAALDLKKDDEVIVPALAVVMDAYAALHVGCKPIFADVDKDSFLITAENIKKVITKKTKAIITVSLQGLPVDIDPIIKLAKKYKLKIIEDNAQDYLGKYKNKLSGVKGDISTWSFENKKHLSGCTEGGMITTNSKRLAEKIRKFAGIGYKNMTALGGRTSLAISSVQNPNYFRFDTVGLNYRMSQIVAAVCYGQLQRSEEISLKRIKVANIFLKAIKNSKILIPQKVNYSAQHSYYTFPVKYIGKEKYNISWKKFYDMYKKLGGDGFYSACKPIYLEPAIKNYFKKNICNTCINYKKNKCCQTTIGKSPNAERLQIQIMQFKTNYRDLNEAKKKANILRKLISIIEN